MMHFFRNTQQRDCPGVSPDSLFIRTPEQGLWNKTAAKVGNFPNTCNQCRQKIRADRSSLPVSCKSAPATCNKPTAQA